MNLLGIGYLSGQGQRVGTRLCGKALDHLDLCADRRATTTDTRPRTDNGVSDNSERLQPRNFPRQ
jgi:hypothetical protein